MNPTKPTERRADEPARWTRQQLATLRPDSATVAEFPEPVLEETIPGIHLWDPVPVLDHSGAAAVFQGEEMWLALSADARRSRDDRHDVARLRLLSHGRHGWRDHGNLMPDKFSRGSREWSGSATFEAETQQLQLYYTAAGSRGERRPTFGQRMYSATARMLPEEAWLFGDWADHREMVRADGRHYRVAQDAIARPGSLTAFRDPGWFCDPRTGEEVIVFAASNAATPGMFNGAIGLARRRQNTWALEAPLLVATGVATELEIPHVVCHEGHYYLFWSTAGPAFAPGIGGVTGLYGMVASSLRGPYRPLNGTGLVLCNAHQATHQCYGWRVLQDLTMIGFVDEFRERPDDTGRFSGALTPRIAIELQGQRASAHATRRNSPNTETSPVGTYSRYGRSEGSVD